MCIVVHILHIYVYTSQLKMALSMVCKLFPPQQALLDIGYPNVADNWLICAPTGSGKTRMAEWAITDTLRQGYRAAYIAPLRAIVEERYTDWPATFPGVSLGLFTGEKGRASQSPKDETLLLFTPEKLASYLHNWKTHLHWLSELGVLIIDEFHLLGDQHRGPTIEALITQLRRINPYIRFIGLSATLPNAVETASWMQARLFTSDWRPIPLERTIRHFKRAADKPGMLLAEIAQTHADGGKALVFVNSRKRAEALTKYLREHAIQAAFSHAGLPGNERDQIHRRMRAGELDALVATSTVEMGVNFPARKVIIYDAYTFDGEAFGPISTSRYLQFSGRAGRPGLDNQGESVIFLPVWDGNAERYQRAQAEPIRSGFFNTDPLLRVLLSEVSTRLSISERHLETNFAQSTLWRSQGGAKQLHHHIKYLKVSGLLKEKEKDDATYLSATALGRIATQMSVSPSTVILFSELLQRIVDLTDFDLLLAVCLASETTPKLGFAFEEVDELGDILLETPSQLLDKPNDVIRGLRLGIRERALLSAIKCAVILHLHAKLTSLEELAERFDCYPSDLQILRSNAGWILEVAQRVFGAVQKQQQKTEAEPNTQDNLPNAHAIDRCRALIHMIEYGIPEDGLALVNITGVGPKRAQCLYRAGIVTPQAVVAMSPTRLAEILTCGNKVATAIKEAAKALAKAPAPLDSNVQSIQKIQAKHPVRLPDWPSDIDPYRLRRALELNIDHLSPEVVRLSGGTEPHEVRVTEDTLRRRSYTCDCQDFAKGHQFCKHVLRARMAMRDDKDLQVLLGGIQAKKKRPLRYALVDLWMQVGRQYDAYYERQLEDSANRKIEPTVVRTVRGRR
jgi:helicase